MRSSQRGKVVALAALLAAVVVAALALRRPIEDAWLLHVLRRGDPAARQGAAVKLVEHECWRAVPDLLEAADRAGGTEYPLEEYVIPRLARPAALPYIRDALESPDLVVRTYCAQVLDRMAPFDRETVRLLASALEDDDDYVRGEAASALSHLGPLARDAVPALRRMLEARPRAAEATLCRSALAACGQLDVTEVKLLFSSDRPEGRKEAVELLGAIRAAPSVSVPLLGAALLDENGEVREEASKALADLSRERDDALRALVEALPSTESSDIGRAIVEAGDRAASIIEPLIASDPSRRYASARVLLARIWRNAGVLRPQVLASLEGRGPLEIEQAVLLCADLGPAARDAVPALERMLEAKEVPRRLAATVALARVRPGRASPAPEAAGWVSELLRAWDSEDQEVREAGSRILIHAGPEAWTSFLDSQEISASDKRWWLFRSEADAVTFPGSVAPWAIEKLSDSERDLQELAGLVLEHVTSGDAGDAMAVRKFFLVDPDGGGCANCELGFKVLLRLGQSADPVLVEVLSGASDKVLVYLMFAMEKAPRPLSSEALNVCLRALRSQKELLPLAASQILGSQPSAAVQVVPALLATMHERRSEDALFVAGVLEKLGAAAVPGLASALRDPWEDVRCLAAFTLGRMGNAAAPALPALEAATRDESDLIRGTAEVAVRAVREWAGEGGLKK